MMDDDRRNPQEGDAAEDIPAEGPSILGSQRQQTDTSHSNSSHENSTYKQRITEWFRRHFGGHGALEWLTFAFEVLTFGALCVYSYFSYGQWQSMREQKTVMQGQLEQMKGTSTQTDRLIGETHTLATNAGVQAANAADQVKKLSALVDATNKQAVATAGELTIMQKQLEAADRPWVKIDIASSDLTYDTSGVKVGLRYIFTNVGKSPAQNIWRSAKLIAAVLLMGVPKGYPEPKEVQRRLCDSLAVANRTVDISGYTLFPGDHFSDHDDLTLSIQEINAFYSNRWEQMPMPRPLPLGIVGCVDYTFESSLRHHQTGFAFLVSGNNGGSPMITEIPMHQLVGLALTPISGFYFAN